MGLHNEPNDWAIYFFLANDHQNAQFFAKLLDSLLQEISSDHGRINAEIILKNRHFCSCEKVTQLLDMIEEKQTKPQQQLSSPFRAKFWPQIKVLSVRKLALAAN